MIKILRKPEPARFDQIVRVKGQRYLATNPHPTSAQFNTKAYWKDSLQDLCSAYDSICAYCCHWIPNDTGSSTVDHYLPKSHAPHLAYEWSNYRLASRRMNSAKKDHLDVVDPFEVDFGWFTLEFPQMIVVPGASLDSNTYHKVDDTIKRLGLNKEINIKSRLRWAMQFACGAFPFEYLETVAPFIAFEVDRQHYKGKLYEVLGRPKCT